MAAYYQNRGVVFARLFNLSCVTDIATRSVLPTRTATPQWVTDEANPIASQDLHHPPQQLAQEHDQPSPGLLSRHLPYAASIVKGDNIDGGNTQLFLGRAWTVHY